MLQVPIRFGRTWALLTLVAVSSGCTINGSGTIISEKRSIAAASEIDVCCGFVTTLTQGDKAGLVIEGDDNLVPQVLADQKDGKLSIGWAKNASYSPSQPIQLHLELPNLREVTSTGGASLFAENLAVDTFNTTINGGGELLLNGSQFHTLNLSLSGGATGEASETTAETIAISANGGSLLRLGGTTDSLDVNLASASSLQAFDLAAADASLALNGASHAEVTVTSTIMVSGSDGSVLVYDGSATLTTEGNGALTVEKR